SRLKNKTKGCEELENASRSFVRLLVPKGRDNPRDYALNRTTLQEQDIVELEFPNHHDDSMSSLKTHA
ncbi:MAG: hypothetical protein WAW90_00020, partial [Minisyncoccia bacterium]